MQAVKPAHLPVIHTWGWNLPEFPLPIPVNLVTWSLCWIKAFLTSQVSVPFFYIHAFSALSDGRSRADYVPELEWMWDSLIPSWTWAEVMSTCWKASTTTIVSLIPQCLFCLPIPGHFISYICLYSSASQFTCCSLFLSHCRLWHHFAVKCTLSPPSTFCQELVWPHT